MSINSQSLMAARILAWRNRVLPLAAVASIFPSSAHATNPRFNHDVNGNQVSQQLVTLTAPTIVTQPKDALLPPGGTVRFHVVASGPGALRYQWRHNTTNIASATNDSLEVAGLATNLTNYGLYTVVISNSAGSVTSVGATVLPDTDSDNLADALEMQNFADLAQNPWDDFDGDGVSNYDEFAYGSSPVATNHYLTNAATWFLHDLNAPTSLSFRWPDFPSITLFAVSRNGAFAVSGAPTGISVNTNTGVLSGSPLLTGQFNATLTAQTTSGPATTQLQMVVPEVFGWGANGQTQLDPPSSLINALAVDAGSLHVIALRADGAVAAWGSNVYGQTNVPAGLTNAVAVAGGAYHSVALRADGTVASWGYNGYGQTNVPAGLTNAVAVDAGENHTLALRADGTVVAWGNNSYGQTNIPSGLGNVVAVAAGFHHTIALRADGTVSAWGRNINGETNVPSGLTNAVAVAASAYHSLALRADGTVEAWGNNGYGQTDVPVGLTNAVAVAAGAYHSLALRADGTVIGWGSNGSGEAVQQSGINSISAGDQFSVGLVDLPNVGGTAVTVPRFALSYVGFGFRLRADAKGTGHTFSATGLPAGLSINATTGLISGTPSQAGTFDVTVRATGTSGQAERSVRIISLSFQPKITSPATASASPGGLFSYQIAANAPATSYAATGLPGGLTLNTNTGLVSGTPAVAGRFNATLTVQTTYGPATTQLQVVVPEVFGWGRNSETQLNTPLALSNAVAVASGYQHALALSADGKVFAWGANGDGQASVPIGLTNAVAVAGGDFHSLALRADGTVAAWGRNWDGQASVPPALTDVVAADAGGYHNLILRADGSVAAWGDNGYGQTNVPSGLTNVIAVAGGGYFSLALRADGRVFAWGYNGYGETNVPSGLTNAVAIAAGGYHALALRADGTVAAWGYNGYGQTNVPSGLTNAVAVSAGEYHSLALRADGTVIGWGSDFADETTQQSSMTAAAAGDGSSFGLVDLPTVGGTAVTVPRFALGYVGSGFRLRADAKGVGHAYSAVNLPAGLSINAATGLITGTPSQAGIYDANVRATLAGGQAEGLLRIVVRGVSSSGFQSWPVLALLPTDRRGPTHRNGPMNLPNMLAYAMALNPTTATPSDLPNVHTLLTDSVKFTFRRAKGVSDVNLTVKGSAALQGGAWTNAPVTQQVITDRGTHETVDVTIPRPSGGRYFLRLEAATP